MKQIALGMILFYMRSRVASPESDQLQARDGLLDLYRSATASYTDAVDVIESLQGEDQSEERFRAQLQALKAHLACENAWNAVMEHQPGRIR